MSVIVVTKGVDSGLGQTCLGGELLEAAAIVAENSRIRADPQKPVAILIHRVGIEVGEAVLIAVVLEGIALCPATRGYPHGQDYMSELPLHYLLVPNIPIGQTVVRR